MTTEKKKALLVDAHNAIRALGRILDGGHDLSELKNFPAAHAATLRDQSLGALSGLTLLKLQLIAEIGTDNL